MIVISKDSNLFTQFCNLLENDLMSEFIKRVGVISNLLRNNRKGSKMIVRDRYEGGRGSTKRKTER